MGETKGASVADELPASVDDTDLYSFLKGADILSLLHKCLNDGMLTVDEDSEDKKLVLKTQRILNTQWLFGGIPDWHRCYTDMDLIHRLIMPSIPHGLKFTPSRCFNCFKVVAKPNTLEQLMLIWTAQQQMGLACKCGIEDRPFVHSNYGAYWYNSGLEAGLACYKEVKELLDSSPEFDGIDLLLKRSCSEYEIAAGDSKKWKVTQFQLHIENLLDTYLKIANEDSYKQQTEYIVTHTLRRWIEYAAQNGDETYKQYTGGRDLGIPVRPRLIEAGGVKYRTYHHLVDKTEEEIAKFWEE